MRRSVYFLLSVAVCLVLGCKGDGSIIDYTGRTICQGRSSQSRPSGGGFRQPVQLYLLQETVKQNPGRLFSLSLSASGVGMACNGAMHRGSLWDMRLYRCL